MSSKQTNQKRPQKKPKWTPKEIEAANDFIDEYVSLGEKGSRIVFDKSHINVIKDMIKGDGPFSDRSVSAVISKVKNMAYIKRDGDDYKRGFKQKMVKAKKLNAKARSVASGARKISNQKGENSPVSKKLSEKSQLLDEIANQLYEKANEDSYNNNPSFRRRKQVFSGPKNDNKKNLLKSLNNMSAMQFLKFLNNSEDI